MPSCKRPDVDLYYEISGNGPPVIMIQGVGACGEAWRPQIDELSASFTTLLFDNRGIGRSQPCTGPITIESMVEDARHLMDAVGWQTAHVMGHSMGGVIAQQLALDRPERIRSLSLLCTFARGKDAARITPAVLWMTLKCRVGSRASRRRAFLDLLFAKEFLRTADLDQWVIRVGLLVGRDLADSPPILMKQLGALGRHDSSKRLAELAQIPTLVISGEYDPIALPRYGKAIAEGIPGAHFESWPGASHGLTIQTASELNRRLKGFLDSVESSSTPVISPGGSD